MIKRILAAATVVVVLTAYKTAGHNEMANKEGYLPPAYAELPLGAIKPKGWLKDQLATMLRGTSGHLDEVYNKVKDDNGWLGGKGDGWEETPYWLDGALPLAWLMDDAAMKAKMMKYVDWTLDHQRASGYFGPITEAERKHATQITIANADQGDDWWPRMVMLKVIQQYYTATHDKRVIPFMTRYFHYQLAALKKAPVNKWSEWAESRGAENIMVAQWLYSITKDKELLQLANLLDQQSFAWSKWFGSRDWVIDAATQQNDKTWMRRHGVNVAMALKAPALNYQRTADKTYLKDAAVGFHDLMTLHGLPMGMFSADEDLHGNLPTQGTELCAIVETMFSLEEMISISGDTDYMDALERMTFNALPTQTTDDYNAKQYFQIPNQVEIARGVFDFSLPFDRGMNNVLGMRSGYTCCLANMHQGWTKYTTHLWYKTAGNGVAALVYGPNQLSTTVGKNNTPIVITEDTEYPFNDGISLKLELKKATTFPLQLRIPEWCHNASVTINGQHYDFTKSDRLVTINREWSNNDVVRLTFPMEVTTSNWGRNSRTVERGPLVYALQLGEKWEKGHDDKEGDYFAVYPEGKWNYGLLTDVITNPKANLKVTTTALKYPFVWNQEHAPITITASGKELPQWKLSDGVANQPITDRGGVYKGETSQAVETFKLIPYGFTKVRIVAFPVVK